jgi:predicted transposase YbfD/YdcC
MQSVITILREVRDPRDYTARHDLAAMLFVALVATLCGCKSCVEIADFALANLAELGEFVDLPHGAPSHDSFSRVFRLLDPAELEQALRRFAGALREGLGLGERKGVVAIDGKRLRRGYERGRACLPPLLVSVWDAETRLSIAAAGAPPEADPGNEVAATLAALKGLDLKRCTVTADALHCHPAMTAALIERGADFAIRLKANNAPLFNCALTAFAKADASGRLARHERRDQAHDRQERRGASVVASPDHAPALPGLAAFGRIDSERITANGTVARTVHYVVLSRKLTPQRLGEVFRAHWSVENQLHRQLDVVFREDDARSRKNHAPLNLGIIRRMALDILRAHPDTRSIQRKMNLARWKKDFLLQLFTHLR